MANSSFVVLNDSKFPSLTNFDGNIFNVLFGIFLTFAIILTLYLTYYVKLKKVKDYSVPKGFVFVFQLYIDFIENLTLEILGKKFKKITPFFIYLFLYILVSNTISIFGFTNPTSSLSVTLMLGLVTFIGIFFVGFKFQRLSYLKKYTINIKTKKNKTIPIMVNPLNVVGQVTPLISLSFRLWGNIFAGSLITSMIYLGTEEAFDGLFKIKGLINVFGLIALIPMHLYFDILSGVIQTLVFVLLTMIYWKMEAK